MNSETGEKWKEAARRAGVCMTCALGAPDTFGCSDCLNTGWEQGAPVGFRSLEECEAHYENAAKDKDRKSLSRFQIIASNGREEIRFKVKAVGSIQSIVNELRKNRTLVGAIDANVGSGSLEDLVWDEANEALIVAGTSWLIRGELCHKNGDQK